MTICSNDPVCADHEPGSAIDERALLGTACYGCLLIAETNCERRNNFIDPLAPQNQWPRMEAAFFEFDHARPQKVSCCTSMAPE